MVVVAVGLIAIPVSDSEGADDNSGDIEWPKTTIEVENIIKGHYKWKLNSEGVLEITANGSIGEYSPDNLPSWHEYKDRIKSIVFVRNTGHDYQVNNCYDIQIGSYSFYGFDQLESIKLVVNESKAIIGGNAFNGCTKLKYISTNGEGGEDTDKEAYICGFNYISYNAFENTALESLTLKNTSIGIEAFRDCKNLKEITIDNVSNALTYPDGPVWGENFFILSSGEDKRIIDVTFCSHDFETYQQRQYIELFKGLNLNNVYVESGATIYWQMFSNCKSIESLFLPLNVGFYEESDKAGYFIGCDVKTIIFESEGSAVINNELVSKLLGKGNTQGYIQKNGNGTIVKFGKGVTKIADYAFKECPNVSSVVISDGMSVGEFVFMNCQSIEDLTIPDDVTLDASAFAYTTGLQSVTFGNIPYIEEGLFYGCSDLRSVVIPSSVHFIEYNAFYECNSLNNITFMGEYTEIDYVGTDQYNDETEYEGVLKIGQNAFHLHDWHEPSWSGDRSQNIIEATVRSMEGWTAFDVNMYNQENETGETVLNFENDYMAILNSNSGTVTPSIKNITAGQNYPELPVPVRSGYTFEGWFTEAEGGTKITSDIKVKTVNDLVLYAHWEKMPTYTITFDPTGGRTNVTSKELEYGDMYGTLPSASKTGYVFDGWFTSRNGGTEVKSTDIFRQYSNQTLYAQWTPIDYSQILSNYDRSEKVTSDDGINLNIVFLAGVVAVLAALGMIGFVIIRK